MRWVLAGAAAAWGVAAAVLFVGGISFRVGGLLVRSHSAIPALAVAAVLTIVALMRRASAREALQWWWNVIERRGELAALGFAALAVVIGVQWGTFAAGGSDSYCYLNQAELFARGEVHDFEKFGTDPEWPGTPGAFVPAGHSPVPSRAGEMVPICPAGYPLMLAAAKKIVGRDAMFWVTPLMGGLAVWLTFLLGRTVGRVFRPGETAGGATGLLASLLLLTSPIFVYQVVQPMNDVPATALWCAALVIASREGMNPRRRAAIAGLLAGAALTVRPNLLPLAAVIGLWMALRGPAVRAGLTFAAGALPGVLIVLGAQAAVYGSPLRSGYGDLSALFSLSHIGPNLSRYPRWVLDVQSPILLLALTGPLVLRGAPRRTGAWLLAFCAAVFACYLPYVVFDDWWYQRFVLPAFPPLLALTAAAIVSFLVRLPPAPQTIAFGIVCSVFALVYVNRGIEREAFRLREHEYRFRAAGEHVATLPQNAAIITGHQTGSIRFYSGRSTVGWGDIPPGRLADAIDYLRRQGRKPYLLFESWEEPNFRARFPTDPLGGLAWPPTVEINRTVRIYDPDDYPKYMRGDFVPTERIVTHK